MKQKERIKIWNRIIKDITTILEIKDYDPETTRLHFTIDNGKLNAWSTYNDEYLQKLKKSLNDPDKET